MQSRKFTQAVKAFCDATVEDWRTSDPMENNESTNRLTKRRIMKNISIPTIGVSAVSTLLILAALFTGPLEFTSKLDKLPVQYGMLRQDSRYALLFTPEFDRCQVTETCDDI